MKHGLLHQTVIQEVISEWRKHLSTLFNFQPIYHVDGLSYKRYCYFLTMMKLISA